MRVLLVEDDALLGSGIRDALEQARYVVEWVRDGALALEALRGANVDLVVLDLGLPKLDGMEVLRRARELGLPASRVVPYLAELAFARRDFVQVRALLQTMQDWEGLSRLQPVLKFWGQA